MNKQDIPYLSATELSRLIAAKEISPLEVTKAYLDRIDSLDFKFNSYITVSRKKALQAAWVAEQNILRGNYLGPMHGLPVAVKDQIRTRGIRTTGGSHILADFIPEDDATVIANLYRAGAILLGKLNMTELALATFSHRYSTPRNPWNLDMSAGGSSSGSGAATAAFLCATSLGVDTGGSIRRPASWCGLVGLRPSWGRVSRYGLMPGVWSSDAIGPISRTVEDAAITLGAIAGYDPKDPYTWNTPVPDYTRSLDGNIKGIRVGVLTEEINSDVVEPEVRDAVTRAVSVLSGLVGSVEEVSLPLAKYGNRISSIPTLVEPALNYREWIKNRLSHYGHEAKIRHLTGSIIPAQIYYKAQKLRVLLAQQVNQALEKYDVLVLPTGGKPSQRIEGDDPVMISQKTVERLPYMFNHIFSIAGAPTLSMPCGLTTLGLPIGLQIGSRQGGEETLIKVAHAYQQHTHWHTLRPPAA